jgi:mannosylglycerate hydrolase
MQNFIDVSDNNVGVTILNKGLREYEVIDDLTRTIAITLLRTHRAYMTANSDMTPEEFDRYTGLHSFGTLEYNYAIFPHKGNWEEACSLQIAYQHKVPLCAIHGVHGNKGKLPAEKSFITIKPADKLILSALKQAEDGSGIILRIWNSSNNKVSASIILGFSIKSALLLKLDETPVSELNYNGKKIELQCGPHKIITILLKIN